MTLPTPEPPPAPRLAVLLGIVGLLAMSPAAATTSPPVLATDDPAPAAGYFRLAWDTGGGTVELQEARREDFADARLVYRGSDSASVLSGKPGGLWYYRLRGIGGSSASPWSDTVTVHVQHHSLGRAFFFLGAGALVFGATALLVFTGSRR